MVTDERPIQAWGPRPGEDWKAHRMRVFAEYPEMLAVLRIAESREQEAEIWREWHLAMHEGDPEMQRIIRESKYDLDSMPEEDEEDIRVSREQGASDTTRLNEEFMRWFSKRFPGQADRIPAGL